MSDGVGSPVGAENLEQTLCNFDELSAALREALSALSRKNGGQLNLKDLEVVRKLTTQLKKLAASPTFPEVLSRRLDKVLQLLLVTLRYRSPSLQTANYSVDVRKALSDCLKAGTEGVVGCALLSAEWAQVFLHAKLSTPQDAFPISLLLSMIISAIWKRGHEKRKWWMTIDANGHLLLVRQFLQSVGALLPEICLPVVMRVKETSFDIYTFLLTSVCTLICTLEEAEMTACAAAFLSGLRSTGSPFSALFASDVLKFISRIAASAVTHSLLLDAVTALTDSFQTGLGSYHIIHITCCRLVEELSPQDKMALYEQLPTRKHFFIWSHLPPRVFLQLPIVLEELYNESLLVLREAVAGPPRSSVALTCMLCRLPLSLHCLCSLAAMTDAERRSVPAMENFTKDLSALFNPLWKLLMAVPEKSGLEMVKVSFSWLLRLAAFLATSLPDDVVSSVVEDINCASSTDVWMIPSASQFVGALGKRSRLKGDLPDLIKTFFCTCCLSRDVTTRNAAVEGFRQFATWTRCESVLQCGKINAEFVSVMDGFCLSAALTADAPVSVLTALQGHLERNEASAPSERVSRFHDHLAV